MHIIIRAYVKLAAVELRASAEQVSSRGDRRLLLRQSVRSAARTAASQLASEKRILRHEPQRTEVMPSLADRFERWLARNSLRGRS